MISLRSLVCKKKMMTGRRIVEVPLMTLEQVLELAFIAEMEQF